MTFLNTFSEKDKILKTVEFIVLDECDKYFEECNSLFISAFLEQIKAFLEIFSNLHPIYALFSATIQHPVE
jgi:superfamily II DNA/RNA helicase